MNRKLVVLNAVLLLVVVFGGVQLRNQHEAAQTRQAALHAARISPAPAPPFVALPNDPPVLPSGYKDVAMKDLFHPSRNPDVEVPPPPAPPPPPPMPELPRFHGQMNLGDGPIALLVEKAGMPEKAIKPGETIGQFKLVDVNTNEITFAWSYNGELVRRSLSSMMDRTASSSSASPSSSSAASSAAATAAAALAAAGVSESDARPAPPPAPPQAPPIKSAIGPGELTNQGTRICDPNDSTPAGSVVDGFKKTQGRTPFGAFCVWDPVK
jgi:hypothetical protein